MKHPLLLCLTILLTNCGSKSDQQDADAQDTIVAEMDTAAVAKPIPLDFSVAQDQLDRLRADFNKASGSLIEIWYEEQREYEGRSTTYLFSDDNELNYIFTDVGAEGGVGHTDLTGIKTNEEAWLHLDLDQPGYFICKINGVWKSYSVTYSNDKPTISGLSDQEFPDYESGLGMLMSNIKKNLNAFETVEDWAVFYLKRDSSDSEYGRVEIFERYRIDPKLLKNPAFFSDK